MRKPVKYFKAPQPDPEQDDWLRAEATAVEGPAYLVKLNRKAAASLQRLAREHSITPEDALTVAALVMLRCGSGDCWAGDCFRELLHETSSTEPTLTFIGKPEQNARRTGKL